MKHLSLILFVFAISLLVNSQPWIKNIPEDKMNGEDLTFYEIQKAFNDYWEPFNVVNGYYDRNGEQVKAPYWKQFKRWEWYWESRINPETGEFPKTSAWDELQKFQKEHPGFKSPSGNWTSLGPNTTSGGYAGLGRLNCVAFVPNDNNTIYVGAASGGIWKTTNGGSSWTPLGDNNPVLGVSDIIVYRPVVGPDIIYIATGDRDGGSMWSLGGGQYNDNNSVGVLKSTDGGTTWNTTGLTFTASQQRTVNRMLMDPGNINTLYAATSVGLYKTTNAGTSWSLLTTNHFVDIKFNPGTSSTIYGSTYGGDIYRSTNSGSSWSAVHSTSYGRTELAVSANNSSVVYAVMESGGGLAGVYKSTNSGASFTQVFSGATTNMLNWDCNSTAAGGQGSYDLCIAADPTNVNNVFVGGVNTWRSSNGGTSWTITNHWTSSWGCGVSEVHADQHFLAYQNGTSTLFECNDGGLYRTANNGTSWTHHGSGLVTSQIYRLGVSQTSSNHVVIGLQDNGTKALITGSWYDVMGGDGFECAIDPTTTATQYGSLYYGRIQRTTNTWGSRTDITNNGTSPLNGLNETGHWVTPYVIDPNINTTLYVGMVNVWKSTNQGNAWTKLSNWTGSNTIRSLAVAASNSNYIYAATQSILYRTTNGGTSWTNITGSLPTGSGSITYVSVKSTDPNTIWVSLGGYNSFGVYQSTNGGSSWTNISAGLPSIPVMCVIQNKQNTTQDELYVGTDAGVYVKIGSSSWSTFYFGLPNVVVTELEIYYDATPANSRIRAATFGRGLWESDLHSVAIAPVADFTADDVTPLVGQTVTFTDLSANIPNAWAWSFNPPTVTFTGGTNANFQNPQVQFNNNGVYSVTLVSTNAIGSDSEIKTNYIHAGTPGLWTGLTTQDWNTSSNWHNYMVPSSSEVVTIPPVAPNWPVYTGNFEVGTDCNDLVLEGASEMSVSGNLTIQTGNSITCNADATIYAGGDWINDGTFNSGTGTVILNGNTNTNINASGLALGSLQTTFAGGNGSAGNMFDIVAINDVTITNFDANLDVGTGNVSIYYKAGTFVGFETNSSAWTLVGSMVIISSGAGAPTSIPIPVLVAIPAGQTYAFYIHDDNGNDYTNGSSVGNVYASDANIQFLEGCGKSNPIFTGSTYQPRVFNGNIHYNYSSGSGSVTLNKLIINKNNAEVVNNVSLDVNEDLTITPEAWLTNASGSTINVLGNMILEGTSSGKASYIDYGTTNVVGSSIMESFYTDDRWHFISSPVSNAVSNIFLDLYLKHWNEADSTWTYISSTDSLLRVGQGYEIWSTIGDQTIQYTDGIFNMGNFSPALTATDQGGTPGIGDGEGWNFVGNPYPSAINWGTGNNPIAGYVKTNLDNTIYCWNGINYATYNPAGNGGDGLSTNGGSQYIQSLQSFFVKALNINPVLTIPNGARIHSAQANLKSITETQLIRLLVSGIAGSDEIVIEVNENSSSGFDGEFDAYKLWGYDNVPQFYFSMMDKNLSVNVIPEIESNDIFELGFKAGIEDVFTIEATQIENLDAFEYILLEDLKSNTIVNLKENPVYSFSGSPVDNNNRFLLKFSDDVLDLESIPENNINVYAFQNTIYVRFLSDFKAGNLVVYDLLGQEVFRERINNVENKTVPVSAETGYYLVYFETSDQLIVKKVILK